MSAEGLPVNLGAVGRDATDGELEKVHAGEGDHAV